MVEVFVAVVAVAVLFVFSFLFVFCCSNSYCNDVKLHLDIS